MNSSILINKTVGYSLILVSMILYIYTIKLNIPPFYTLIPLLIIGTIVFILKIINNRLRKDIFMFFMILIGTAIWVMITYTLNTNSDLFYLKEIIFFGIILFLSSFAFIPLFKFSKLKYNFENLLLFISSAVLLQLIFSTIANFNKEILNIATSIINLDGLSDERIKNFQEARFIGLGGSFFKAGIIHSYILILIGYAINKKENIRYKTYLFMSYISIALLGLLYSRSTIIGIILSLFFFINIINIIKNIKILIFTIPMLFFLVYLFKESKIEQIAFAYDFIFNKEDSQASSSLSVLQEMYKVLPNNYFTWILGDSRFKNVSESGEFLGYYKGIDIGYLRIIFYNGIIGLIIFISTNLFLLKKSFINDKKLAYILFVCFIILNIKGLASVFSFCFLFFIIKNNEK